MTSLLSKLIIDFFKSEKNIDYVIRPPVKTLEQKIKYIIGEISSAYNRAILDKTERDIFNAEIEEVGNQPYNYRSESPAGDFLEKNKRGIYVIEMVASEMSLRDIKTVATDFENRIRYFGNEISWIDILALSFVKSRYPELIRFFEDTADYFDEKSIMNREFPAGLRRSGDQNEKNEAFDLFLSIHLPGLDKNNKTKYMNLIGLVAHFYFDKLLLKNSSNAEERSLREQSTSNYSYFKKYFMEEREYKDFDSGSFKLYRLLIKDFGQLSKIENIELYNLSQFVRNRISLDTDPSFYIKLAGEILSRFENNRLPFSGFDYSGDSLRIRLTYEFCYLILWYLENTPNNQKAVTKSNTLFTSFLKSPEISYSSKFIVISAFVNHEKAGRGDVDFRFERVWRDTMRGESNSELVGAIKNVFSKYEKQFFINKEKSIYEGEEHYTYLMYQFWSGKTNDGEVEKIRSIALNGLEKHKDVVEKYWSYYPSINELTSGDMFVNIKYSQSDSQNLYMPIKNLIEVSKKIRGLNKETRTKLNKWIKNFETISNNEKYRNLFKLKDKNDTLKELLIRKGIL